MMIILASCDYPQAKFNKATWQEKIDWDYPYRKFILKDLLEHHQIKGLTKKQLIDSLGTPANWGNPNIMPYEILTDFGSDVDPVYTKTLVISLNKDSIATGFKVVEWKK